jgi:hypothetical protein
LLFSSSSAVAVAVFIVRIPLLKQVNYRDQ